MSTLFSLSLPDPPTSSSLQTARMRLETDGAALSALQARISAAERALAETIAAERAAIRTLQTEHSELRQTVECMRGYLAPIRRLPRELIQEVFLWNWEEQPCVGWVLSAVCQLWRRTSLGMPMLWTKIRLVTTPSASPDTIRLWLERAGPSLPLDIEIFLRVSRSPRRHRTPQLQSHPLPVYNNAGYPTPQPLDNNGLGLVDDEEPHSEMPGLEEVPSSPIAQPTQSTWVWFPANTMPPQPSSPIVFPLTPPGGTTWHQPPPPPPLPPLPYTRRATRLQLADDGNAWGHVALYYLTAQMSRWSRFIFRFDKQFASWTALKSINAVHAPLLCEFEISCADTPFYGDWPWLPCASPSSLVSLPNLRSVTLAHCPFKWNSPMLRPNLTSLSLRALPSFSIALDRLLSLARANPNLEELDLYFINVLQPVLPLAPLTLPHLHTLVLGGHFTLSALLDTLALPALASLALDIEVRDAFDDHLSQLMARSAYPPLRTLSLGYASSAHGGSPYYYNAGGLVGGWHWLSGCNALRTLRVGNAPLEPLLSALGLPDDDDDGPGGLSMPNGPWLCPHLTTLALKSCPAHPDGVPKLVQLIELRNPSAPQHSGSGHHIPTHGPVSGLARLKRLEIIECTSVGADVVAWIQDRVEEVVCVDIPYERRRPGSPPYAYM